LTAIRYYVAVLKSLELHLRKHQLVRPGERVGVAVSGGADSVALLRALASLAPTFGIVPFVLHLNHNLRGSQSEADASFVASLAARLSLDCAIDSEDVAALATRLHFSLEAAGRQARYAFFLRAAVAHRLDAVATAHTRDDQAETVLLRLLRGTGTSGLAGIHRTFDLADLVSSPHAPEAYADDGRIHRSPRLIRPLLSTTRKEIEEYLRLLDQAYTQDASNLVPQFLRNRIRAELLPCLERDYNPRLREALCETAEVAAAENDFLEELVNSMVPEYDNGLDLNLLQSQPLALQRRILRRLCRIHALALDFAQLESLREFALASCAGSLPLPRGFSAQLMKVQGATPHLLLIPPSAEPEDSLG
jgi:tRNA(Ile)-lysidine synthase